ncbi:MAG: hypothetical protein KatS3mg129_0757 [Leptospiraceae bacterium]|nr:MAG: hypothetical protein KatS3mg129_0757 [Leptospiraceae bacterium]
MRNFLKNISIILLLININFCITSNAGITTSNIPLNHKNITYIATDTVQKSWWNFDIGILGFPLEEPPIDHAIQELLSKHKGDALINIRYYTKKSIFLFMTRNTLVVKADIVKIENTK